MPADVLPIHSPGQGVAWQAQHLGGLKQQHKGVVGPGGSPPRIEEQRMLTVIADSGHPLGGLKWVVNSSARATQQEELSSINQSTTHFQHCAGCVQGVFVFFLSMTPHPELPVTSCATASEHPDLPSRNLSSTFAACPCQPCLESWNCLVCQLIISGPRRLTLPGRCQLQCSFQRCSQEPEQVFASCMVPPSSCRA